MDKRNGVPFTKRCELAIASLQGHRSDIAKLQEDNLLKLEAMRHNYPEAEGDTSEVREMLTRWAKEDMVNLTSTFEKMVEHAWSFAIKSTRTIFGDDATDFALKAIEKQPNAN
jgi:hypothetical protein